MTVKILMSQAQAITSDFPAEVEAYRQELLAHRFSAPATQYQAAVPPREAIIGIPHVKGARPVKDRKGRVIKPGVKGHPGRRHIPAHPGTPEVAAFAGVARPTHHLLVEACVRRVPQEGGPDDFVTDYELVDDLPKLRAKKDTLIGQIVEQEVAGLAEISPPGKRRLQELRCQEILLLGEENRTSEEKQFLTDYAGMIKRMNAIQKRAAELMAEIEDLTDETVDGWSGKL